MAYEGIIEGSDFKVHHAPHALMNDLPLPDEAEFGEAWTGAGNGAWAFAGSTVDGVAVQINVERGELRVDQEVDPVLRPVQSRSIVLTTQLAELANVELLQLAAGIGTLESEDAGADAKGYDDLIIGSKIEAPDYNSWGVDVQQQDGEPFRGIVYKGLATGNPQPNFQRNDSATTVGVEITALVDGARLAKFRRTVPAA